MIDRAGLFLMAAEEQPAQLKNRHGFLARYGELIALILLIVVVSFINIVWIRQDTRPQPGVDANVYLANTLASADGLKEQRETKFWASVSELSMDGRPPLYQLLTIPFIYILGRSADAALSVNILFGVILLLSTYGIGKLILNGWAGLLAALLLATYPPIVNLSKVYRPDFATAAWVALSLWLLLLLLKTRSVRVAWLFGATLGLGMLIRHFFALHLFVPTVVFGVYMLLFQTDPRRPSSFEETPRWLLAKLRDPFVLRGLLPAALIATGLTAAWYLSEAAAPLFALQEEIQAQDLTVSRGFTDVAPYSLWWYALTMPGAISNVFTVLFAIGLVSSIVRPRLHSSVLVVSFLASYVALSLQRGLSWQRFAAVLPEVAAITAIWIVGIRNRLLSSTLAIVCLVVASVNFSVVTWGATAWSQPVARALGAPLDSATCSQRMNMAFCPNPARDQNWRVSDVLGVVLAEPECQARSCQLMILHAGGTFSDVIFQYYLTQDFPQAQLEISGVRQGTQAELLQSLLNSGYLLYVPVPEAQRSSFGDLLTQFVRSPPGSFANAHQEMASFELPNGAKAHLLKRVKPLTIAEAEASIVALAELHAKQEKEDAVVHLERCPLQLDTEDDQPVALAICLVEAYESLGDREYACVVLREIEQWTGEGDGRLEELRERLACSP
jgi:hypothetical protein